MKKYGGASVLNQIMPDIIVLLQAKFPNHVSMVYVWETKKFRYQHYISKDHDVDAYCIAAIIFENRKIDSPQKGEYYSIIQFRRHDKHIIQSSRNRYYFINKKKVAINRHKACTADLKSKAENSLAGWREEITRKYSIAEARQQESRLRVVPANHIKKTPNRSMLGSVFQYSDGKSYVMSGNYGFHRIQAVGYGTLGFSRKKATFVAHNKGLTYV